MFVVHYKGVQRTGDHPTLLYGYGGTWILCIEEVRRDSLLVATAHWSVTSVSHGPVFKVTTPHRVQHQPGAGVQRRAPVLHLGVWRRRGGGQPQVLCGTAADMQHQQLRAHAILKYQSLGRNGCVTYKQ